MTSFTRLVIVGTEKRATLVLPSDDPVGTHLGAIVKLVHEPDPEGDLLTLVHATGASIDLTVSLESQGVLDGTALHLVRSRDVPPEPEVSDVSDLVTREFEGEPAKTERHRHTAATLASGVLTFVIVAMLAGFAAPWVVPVVTVAGIGVAVACALLNWRSATRIAVAISIALAGVLMLQITGFIVVGPSLSLPTTWSFFPASAMPWLTLAAVSAIIGVVLGVCEQRIAPALGGIVGVVLGLTGWVARLITADPAQTAAIVALLTLVILALTPSLALTYSGLTKLDDLRNAPPTDDAVAATHVVTRTRAITSLTHAYQTFQWVTVTAAVALAVAIPTLFVSASGWFVSLAVIVSLISLLRARVTPRSLSSWALYLAPLAGATLVPLILAVFEDAADGLPWLTTHPNILVAGLAVALVLVVLVALLRPAAHTAARLRRQGDLVESMLAIAVVPVMLGGFGIYTALLGVF